MGAKDGPPLPTQRPRDLAEQLLELADRRKLRPARADLELLQKKYGLRLVGVDLVELEPR